MPVGSPCHTLGLAHTWSDRGGNDIDAIDTHALTAAVYISIKMDSVGCSAHFHRSAHRSASASHLASASQHSHVVELATPAPATWIEIFRRRLSLWEEQQLLPQQHPVLLAAPPAVLADFAHLIAETHVLSFLFSANSTASQVGASAWFISTFERVCRLLHAASYSFLHA